MASARVKRGEARRRAERAGRRRAAGAGPVAPEALESRVLYAFGAAVAFQPPNTPAPAGYKADVGLPYGPRTNGLTYGWVGGPNVTAVDRNAAKSPDARSDVFAVLRPTGGGSVWEIAVPNGSYQVRVSAGDATTTNESYKIDAEGVRVVAGKQTAAARWVSGTKTVAVADGKLTVAAAPDTTAKINYILISQQVNGSGPAAGGLTLVNAATDADIGPLVAGQTINLAQTGTQLSVRANPTPAEVGSVKFVLDGGASIRVDNTSAYALAGNAGGDYYAMTPTVGPHTLAVTAYGGADATGPAGATKTVKFTVVASAGTSPPVVPPTIPPTVPPVVPPKVPPVVPPAVPPVVPPAVPPVVPPTVPPVVPPVVPPTVPPAGPVAHDAALDAKLASVLSFAGQQLQATYSDLKSSPGRYPRVTNAGGKWATTNVTEWTVGFYPGELWQMYYQTGDTAWRDKAVQYAAPTKVNGSLVEDVEFRSFLPLAPLYKATGDTKYRDALLQSAASKDSQYSATVGGFNTSWNKSHSGNPRANFGLLMDQLMDMELMFWAAKQPGGKASYRAHAIAHAETTMKYLIRPDGGSYHWGFFDRDTGDFVSGETAQGYQDSSTWARGQAWGIYGFTMVYRETGDVRFLNAAKKMADYFLAHLPADKVPNWDFDAPSQFKDSSATAIAASGLLMMAEVAPSTASKYGVAGRDLLKALTATPYLATGTTSRSILNRGSWYIPTPIASGESGTVWGDYYFLEAINRYLGKI